MTTDNTKQIAPDLVLTDVTIYTGGQQPRLIHNGEIHITDGKICYVGEKPKKERLDAKKRIFYGGALVMPAFLNAHTHLPMNLMRGGAEDMALQKWLNTRIFPMEDKLTGEAVYWATKLACIESLSCGVSTVNDMYFFQEDMLKAVKELPIRAFLTRTIVDMDGETKLRQAEELLREVQQNEDADWISATVSPHAEYTVSVPLLEKTAELAKRYDAIVHVHISETRVEHEDCVKRQGKTPMQVMKQTGILDNPVIAAHCVHVSPEDMDLMKEAGVTVASCPVSNLKLASGIAPLEQMHRKGINLAVGTDGAASNNSLSVLKELRLAALLQKGMTGNPEVFGKEEAFCLATVNPAKALRIDTGCIEVGKAADLVVYSNYQLKASPGIDPVYDVLYAYEDAAVLNTFVNGQLAYERRDGSNICRINARDGQQVDVAEVMAKVREYARKLGYC